MVPEFLKSVPCIGWGSGLGHVILWGALHIQAITKVSFNFSSADEEHGEPSPGELPVPDALILWASLLPGSEHVPDLRL